MNDKSDTYSLAGDSKKPVSSAPKQPSIIIHNHMKGKSFWSKFVFFALVISIMVNFSFYGQYEEYFSTTSPPIEKYHSGNKEGKNKIAIISVHGTIMPPSTERIIKSIKRAREDEQVKGIILSIDSPGGLVADSHQIYHELQLLREAKKPINVIMKRIAASGGLYVAMGAGEEAKIFAEPTCWTGSIGVIIPRFDFSGLAEKYGVVSDPLKTGKFKDALSPFRKLGDDERKLWEVIIDDSYQRFVGLIADNRSDLDVEAVKKLATGQVFTANQALENHLVDKIGFEEDAIKALQETNPALKNARVISYQHNASLMEILNSSEASKSQQQWQALMEATVPQAMYYCSWLPIIPGSGTINTLGR